jgi:hypothetical protein
MPLWHPSKDNEERFIVIEFLVTGRVYNNFIPWGKGEIGG